MEFSAHAKRQGDKLPQAIKRRIIKAVRRLATDPFPKGVRKLATSDYYRLRVGDYRIIYEVHKDKLMILAIRIGHRKDVYRST
ncbi:MAG: type II toxin-antitoxin system RelE/ParE family toxin [Candidatus Marinimicrobia bacterium]|nr:type II toxin-antitoxin system RelE/ParE family toxin [Candidatus Neomarinimicrobiota bacterium]